MREHYPCNAAWIAPHNLPSSFITCDEEEFGKDISAEERGRPRCVAIDRYGDGSILAEICFQEGLNDRVVNERLISK